jgi:hypothetical protein
MGPALFAVSRSHYIVKTVHFIAAEVRESRAANKYLT